MEPGIIQILDGETGSEIDTLKHEITSRVNPLTVFRRVAMSADGNIVVASTNGGEAIIWDREAETKKRLVLGPSERISSPSLSPSGKLLMDAIGQTDAVWSTTTGRRVDSRRAWENGFFFGGRWAYIDFSPNGEIAIHDLETGEFVQSLGVHAEVESVSATPDGRNVATLSSDGSLIIWDARLKLPLLTTSVARGKLTFTSEGHTLVHIQPDGQCRFWRTSRGKETEQPEGPPRGKLVTEPATADQQTPVLAAFEQTEKASLPPIDSNDQTGTEPEKLGASENATLRRSAEVHSANGNHDQAALAFEQISQLEEARLGTDHPRTMATMARLGYELLESDQYVEAEKVLRTCLANRAKRLPDHWLHSHTLSLLGGALLGQGKYREAEVLLLRGYTEMMDRISRVPQEGHARIGETLHRLVVLYQEWDPSELEQRDSEKISQWKQAYEDHVKDLQSRHARQRTVGSTEVTSEDALKAFPSTKRATPGVEIESIEVVESLKDSLRYGGFVKNRGHEDTGDVDLGIQTYLSDDPHLDPSSDRPSGGFSLRGGSLASGERKSFSGRVYGVSRRYFIVVLSFREKESGTREELGVAVLDTRDAIPKAIPQAFSETLF